MHINDLANVGTSSEIARLNGDGTQKTQAFQIDLTQYKSIFAFLSYAGNINYTMNVPIRIFKGANRFELYLPNGTKFGTISNTSDNGFTLTTEAVVTNGFVLVVEGIK